MDRRDFLKQLPAGGALAADGSGFGPGRGVVQELVGRRLDVFFFGLLTTELKLSAVPAQDTMECFFSFDLVDPGIADAALFEINPAEPPFEEHERSRLAVCSEYLDEIDGSQIFGYPGKNRVVTSGTKLPSSDFIEISKGSSPE